MSSRPDQILTLREVIDLLRIGRSTLWKWVHSGELPAYRLGGSRGGILRFRLSDVIAFLERYPAAAPDQPDNEEGEEGGAK